MRKNPLNSKTNQMLLSSTPKVRVELFKDENQIIHQKQQKYKSQKTSIEKLDEKNF